MDNFENIKRAISALSPEEKLAIRTELEQTLAPHKIEMQPAACVNGTEHTSGIVGLFSDEPDVMDRVLETVYEHRARPLRTE